MKEILARGVNRLQDRKSLTGPPYPAQCKTIELKRLYQIYIGTQILHRWISWFMNTFLGAFWHYGITKNAVCLIPMKSILWKQFFDPYTVKKGHARNFSTDFFIYYFYKFKQLVIPNEKVRNISASGFRCKDLGAKTILRTSRHFVIYTVQ
jgi:hypothetical protein